MLAEQVISAAMTDPPVALAVYGHPTVLVMPSKMVRALASTFGLRVKILPGISALDCLIVDLDIDLGTNGIVMYETNYVLVHRPPLDPFIPCLLWQAGVAETRLYSSKPSRPERFQRLQDYLLQYYRHTHKIALAISATSPQVGPHITWVHVDQLVQSYKNITALSTLFIPAERKRKIVDSQLAALLDDPAHLDNITRKCS